MCLTDVENKNKVAVVVVGYNRLLSIQRLLFSLNESIYNNIEVPLVISIDASGNKELYDFVRSYEWNYGEKYVIIREQKLGLKRHIFECGDLTKYFKAVILLEDDLFVSPFFYNYVLKTIDYYQEDDAVACVGLYSYASNIYAALPFVPLQTEYDVYGIQATITWGECWNERMWQGFRTWLSHSEPIRWDTLDIPDGVKNFKRAWSKYFTAYLSVTDRYVIAPYKSFTTNFSEAGEHRSMADNCVQVPIVRRLEEFKFGPISCIIKYDSFFNPVGLDSYIPVTRGNLCVDFYSLRPNNRNLRYLLTTDVLPYKCVREYALAERPIEANVIDNVDGKGIYLYDLSQRDSNGKTDVNTIMSISYRLQMFRPLLLKKFIMVFIADYLKIKIKNLIK